MEDIELLEQCQKCGENLTLMSSIRVDRPNEMTSLDGSEWLVKRCLNCGGYPVEEVVMLSKGEPKDKMALAVSHYTDLRLLMDKFTADEMKEFEDMANVVNLLRSTADECQQCEGGNCNLFDCGDYADFGK